MERATSIMSIVISSIANSVLRMGESHAISRALPFIVKRTGLVWLYSAEQVTTLLRTTCASNTLLDLLSALAIEHALVGHLLVIVSRVLIHLMTFRYSITVTVCSLRLGLICFSDRATVLIVLH